MALSQPNQDLLQVTAQIVVETNQLLVSLQSSQASTAQVIAQSRQVIADSYRLIERTTATARIGVAAPSKVDQEQDDTP